MGAKITDYKSLIENLKTEAAQTGDSYLECSAKELMGKLNEGNEMCIRDSHPPGRRRDRLCRQPDGAEKRQLGSCAQGDGSDHAAVSPIWQDLQGHL